MPNILMRKAGLAFDPNKVIETRPDGKSSSLAELYR